MGGARVLTVVAATALSLGGCSLLPPAPVVVTVDAPAPVVTGAAAPTPSARTTSGSSSDGASGRDPGPRVEKPYVSGSRAWTEVAERTGPALVRIDVAGCDTRVVGSGFFVADDLVVTAGHVATGASALSVQYAGGVVSALVVGIDRTSDVAVLRTAAPVAPATVRLAASGAPSTTAVGLLGFPLGSFDLRATEATAGRGVAVDYGSIKATEAFGTDARVNDAVTGGPVVDAAGAVVGLVTGPALWVSGLDTSADGRNAKLEALGQRPRTKRPASTADPAWLRSPAVVVPAASIAADVARWRDAPSRDLLECYGDVAPPLGDSQAPTVEVRSGHSYARDVAAAISLQGQALNTGGHEVAFAVFTPDRQDRLGGLEKWREEQAGRHWDHVTVRRIVGSGDVVDASVEVRTRLDPAHRVEGRSCVEQEQQVQLRRSGGGWLVHRVTDAAPPRPC